MVHKVQRSAQGELISYLHIQFALYHRTNHSHGHHIYTTPKRNKSHFVTVNRVRLFVCLFVDLFASLFRVRIARKQIQFVGDVNVCQNYQKICECDI